MHCNASPWDNKSSISTEGKPKIKKVHIQNEDLTYSIKRKNKTIYRISHFPMKSKLEPKEVCQILNIKKDLFT